MLASKTTPRRVPVASKPTANVTNAIDALKASGSAGIKSASRKQTDIGSRSGAKPAAGVKTGARVLRAAAAPSAERLTSTTSSSNRTTPPTRSTGSALTRTIDGKVHAPPEAPRPSGSVAKPSARLNPKAVNPMGGSSVKTAFSLAYSKGSVPCRLQHGSVKHKISWSQDPSTLDYNPLFVNLLEGLRETEHPYTFLVPEALKDMIAAPGAKDKIVGLMGMATRPLRLGLGSKDKRTILVSLDLLPRLGACLGKPLLAHLPTILPTVAPHMLSRDAQIRDAVWAALQGLEAGLVGEDVGGGGDGGGLIMGAPPGSAGRATGYLRTAMTPGMGRGGVFEPAERVEVLKVIKSKVPSYTSVF
ncbi:hypothetical protein HDU96_003851 [Phlyctochytrium bullatum]|nr:hypothetical protein HDU96_003851 [Phlyctochytrium bullatum]